jgi:hypothetical protein
MSLIEPIWISNQGGIVKSEYLVRAELFLHMVIRSGVNLACCFKAGLGDGTISTE